MPATVVLGAQWGDEGKGKLVDALAADAAWVVRFQGGNNAGHTIVLGDRTIKLHLLPSGITRREAQLGLGAGMVIDPEVMARELDDWQTQTGEDATQRLHLAERGHLILPPHRWIDGASGGKVGTTGRGIGPAYTDKVTRTGVRWADVPELLADADALAERAATQVAAMQAVGVREPWGEAELRATLSDIWSRFGARVVPLGVLVDEALAGGAEVLLEGAQGLLLDVDHGTYPFVTSSVTGRANSTQGAGIHPDWVTRTIAVVKAYQTRVGNGAFPTELEDATGEHLGRVGHEFGTTTGRKRRCGWIDLVALKHAQRVCGFSELAVTKLDVLGGLDELRLCVAYELDGERITHLPASASALERAVPVYESMPGFTGLDLDAWLDLARRSTAEGSGLAALPAAARAYLDRLSEAIGVPVTSVGVGPDREAIVTA